MDLQFLNNNKYVLKGKILKLGIVVNMKPPYLLDSKISYVSLLKNETQVDEYGSA